MRTIGAAKREKALSVIRAAFADTGHDPGHVYMRDDKIFYNAAQVDRRTAWRAYEISRQAIGRKPCCLACLDAYNATGRSVRGCEADRTFAEDCGADR